MPRDFISFGAFCLFILSTNDYTLASADLKNSQT